MMTMSLASTFVNSNDTLRTFNFCFRGNTGKERNSKVLAGLQVLI